MSNEKMLDKRFLWKDRIYPVGERPDKLDLLVKGKRGKLLCTCFRAGGAGKHPVVVICHGFPGNEKNLDLAASLRRVGFHVVSFHYSGSWGSEGAFSFKNCLEDIDTILEMLADDPSVGADLEHVYLWGQSMGGFLTFHTLVSQSDAFRREHQMKPLSFKAAGAVVAMPADFGVMYEMSEKDPAFKEVTMDLFREGAEWLNETSADLLYAEAAEFAGSRKMEELFHYVDTVPILWIHATEDELIRPEMGLESIMKQSVESSGNVSRLDIETDHMASDRRCELTEATTEWLIEQ